MNAKLKKANYHRQSFKCCLTCALSNYRVIKNLTYLHCDKHDEDYALELSICDDFVEIEE